MKRQNKENKKNIKGDRLTKTPIIVKLTYKISTEC